MSESYKIQQKWKKLNLQKNLQPLMDLQPNKENKSNNKFCTEIEIQIK